MMRSKMRVGDYRPAQFKFQFESEVQVYQGQAAWYFAHLPKELTRELNELFADQKRGFGSLPVEFTLAGIVWTTSIFLDGEQFMLPLKAAVRKEAGITLGSKISVSLLIKI